MQHTGIFNIHKDDMIMFKSNVKKTMGRPEILVVEGILLVDVG